MVRVRLIHWKAVEADERANRLRAAGYEVAWGPLDRAAMRGLREDPPGAVVVDLSRLPSQGRDVALAIRQYKVMRHVPLVFVDGDPEKVARVRELLPDAVYTTWSRIHSSLRQAIAHPPANPVVPASRLAGYAGTPLLKKLGIKANSIVVLIGAPESFEEALGELPEGVMLRNSAQGQCDLVIWFTMSRQDLERDIDGMRALAGRDGIWIVWPKKASGLATDLSQVVVRKVGLAAGLVDYKVAAIDDTWAGLRFTRRQSR